jgi:hypothetical protein
MDIDQTNRLLFGYLEKHERLPQKGFLKKRQITWDEIIANSREELGKVLPSKYVEGRLAEWLNVYLRLTFSVEGWWLDRERELFLSGRWREVVAMERLFRAQPVFGRH